MYEGGTKKEKTVFLHLVWGGRRRYGGVGRKSQFFIPDDANRAQTFSYRLVGNIKMTSK